MPRKMPRKTAAIQPHVIVSGDPGDGFKVFGPFPGPVSAIEWADGDNPKQDTGIAVGDAWWSMPIELIPSGLSTGPALEFVKALCHNERWAHDLAARAHRLSLSELLATIESEVEKG